MLWCEGGGEGGPASQGRFLQGGLTCVEYGISVGNFLSQDMMYVSKSFMLLRLWPLDGWWWR